MSQVFATHYNFQAQWAIQEIIHFNPVHQNTVLPWHVTHHLSVKIGLLIPPRGLFCTFSSCLRQQTCRVSSQGVWVWSLMIPQTWTMTDCHPWTPSSLPHPSVILCTGHLALPRQVLPVECWAVLCLPLRRKTHSWLLGHEERVCLQLHCTEVVGGDDDDDDDGGLFHESDAHCSYEFHRQ